MSQRAGRSIDVEGISHGKAPIPMGARVGPLLMSSGIPGLDAATGTLPDGIDAQVRCAFANLRALLRQGGAGLEHVVRLSVTVKDNAARDAVNREWLACFPDPTDRPARHIVVHDLQHGMQVQLEVVAFVGSAGG
jgi:2-iminobutanoate/2-iminopropanoate deaminase